MPIIQQWISRLIDPDTDVFMEPSSPHSGGQQQSWIAPPPPPGVPPPLPGYNANSPVRNGSIANLVSLALVNQTAAQKAVTVTYPAEQSGPPHQPTWTVKCCSKSYG